MYNIGTVSTTANSPKITGTGTRWKDNTTLISVGQVVLIENGSNLLINSIYSIESNTALTLAFPVSAKLTNAKYIILTTMIDSISDGVNKATAIAIASEVYTDILNQWMTAQGTIDVELPTGQKIKLRTVAEMDKQLDGKLDKSGGSVEGGLSATGAIQTSGGQVTAHTAGGAGAQLDSRGDIAKVRSRNKNGTWFDHSIPETAGTLMQVGDYGWGGLGLELKQSTAEMESYLKNSSTASQIFRNTVNTSSYSDVWSPLIYAKTGGIWFSVSVGYQSGIMKIGYGDGSSSTSAIMYNTKNTTKDSNGNLKAASPIVKLLTDDIELNEESEGVEMEHLGVGHYLIKGVVG
ncbi:phage tail fiber protein, partial [Providencia sp. PROV196]|uniref:phage tail fiber protein n=1 Tax=Providencia sp. PROV196 TaxID=2949897 RepID=UPI00234927EC